MSIGEPLVLRRPLGDDPPKATLYYGENVTEALRRLPAKSVQMVCTSPPYWGLRSYGVQEQIWGGNPECDHDWFGDDGYTGHRGNRGQVPQTKWKAVDVYPQATTPVEQAVCRKCGAWKGCLGLEPTPEGYVKHMVEVFREVRRTLRDDGTVWLNLGDTYMSHPANDLSGLGGKEGSRIKGTDGYEDSLTVHHRPNPTDVGLKDKDLVGIPWRVALALQDDGWYLRSDIIWAKPNPMPSSARDRPTKAHEYIFLLTKQPQYFYDAEAIREPYEGLGKPRAFAKKGNDDRGDTGRMYEADDKGGRNKRTVWTLPTQPYPGAHFAVWPPKLVEPMILAGTSKKGCCSKCGAPWVRQVERGREPHPDRWSKTNDGVQFDPDANAYSDGVGLGVSITSKTVGWEPSCECEGAEVQPCVVMDIFSGSATTGMIAMAHGRDYVGLDLSADYLRLAESRILGLAAPTTDDDDSDNPLLDILGEEDR